MIDRGLTPDDAVARLRRPGGVTVLLDGRGGDPTAWPTLVAIDPKPLPSGDLAAIDRRARARRERGGPGGTGLVVLAAYELFAGRRADPGTPKLAAFEVDAAIRFDEGTEPWVVGPAELPREPRVAPDPAGFVATRPRTSLPRDAYLQAIGRVKHHIRLGDIYQANLTQRFECDFEGDRWALYRALAAATPAPRSAFVEAPSWALASVSPETFVDVDRAGRATTLPIKGTRPRGGTPEEDARLKDELLRSEKDRAELTMIVDLERNDLGRVARVGSVRVPELAALRTYAAVHHLVATVTAELSSGTGFAELMRAIFPGGSITGAPKERAVEILQTLEPSPRGLYTGSLFFLDDDGSTRSSILIRSVVVAGGIASLGAGGGVVADSDPEGEWMESNAKARALARVLGFAPEEAS